jgi:hypothetical protein
MTKIKILILFCFLSVILTGIGWVYAQTSTLEVDYPVFSNAPDPSLLNYLPDYIRYIYVFFVITGGLIALVVIITGGFRYLTSAGNPAVMSDSRNQIFSALIGLIILLGSYVFLNELNPETLTIEPPHLTAAGQGIIVYSDQSCGDGSNALPGVMKPLSAGTRFLRVETTSRVGEENFGTDAFPVGSFYTFNSQEDFTIEFYGNDDCETGWLKTVPNNALQTFGARTCVDNGQLGGTINNVKCIKIIWHKPGVYVYSYKNGNPEEAVPPNECFEIYQNSIGGLPDCLNDKVRSIALVDDTKNKVKYGVVLHNLPKAIFGSEHRGWAHVYIPNGKAEEEITLYNTLKTSNSNDGKDAGSLTVFQINENAIESSMEICRNADCLFQDKYPATVIFDWAGGWKREEPRKREEPNGSISSGSGGLRKLSEIESVYPKIAKGVRFVPDTEDDFDSQWWKTGSSPAFRNIDDCAVNARCPSGISAVKFLREDTTYLGVLYDRADAITKSDWRYAGILHPGGNALLIGTSKPDLAQVGFDGCTGSMLLIKAKIQ